MSSQNIEDMNKDSKNKYSIGVVTYHARFEDYFCPLIKSIDKIFPDTEVFCVLNGHPDKELQSKYLSKATEFLSGFGNISSLSLENHHSLSFCWNQIIISSATEKILILNDDTKITELFRYFFESKVVSKGFSTINKSWSHFLISKDIVRKVGWFDERLGGVGHEDADYALRMSLQNVEITDTTCLGLTNLVVDQKNPGWKSISKKIAGNKYSQQNLDFFKTKWLTMDLNPEIPREKFTNRLYWHGGAFYFSHNSCEPTPLFYDLNILEYTQNINKNLQFKEYKPNYFILIYQGIIFFNQYLLKTIYRLIRNKFN